MTSRSNPDYPVNPNAGEAGAGAPGDNSAIDAIPDPTLFQGLEAAKWLYTNIRDPNVPVGKKLKAAGIALAYARSVAFPYEEAGRGAEEPPNEEVCEAYAKVLELTPVDTSAGALRAGPLSWITAIKGILGIIDSLTK